MPPPLPGPGGDRDATAGSLLRSLALLLGVAAAVGGAGWLIRNRQPSGIQEFALPTGEILSLRSASFGTNHPAPSRFPLEHRLPASWVEALVQRLGISSSRATPITTEEPRLLVWLRVTRPPGLKPGGFTSVAVHLAPAGPATDQEPLWGPVTEITLPPTAEWVPVQFKAFPRHAQRLELRFHPARFASPRPRLGSLTIANPAPVPLAAWTARPCPLTQTQGPVACTILGYLVGTGRDSVMGQLPDGTHQTTYSRGPADEAARAALRLFFTSAPSAPGPWTVGRVAVTDAAGTRITAESSSASQTPALGSTISFDWSPVPWPDSIWELQVEARRAPTAAFTPEEQVVFEGVPLPALDGTNRPGLMGSIGGTSIELTEIVRKAPLDGNQWNSEEFSKVRVAVQGMPEGAYFDWISVTDDQGRTLEVLSRSETSGLASSPREIGIGFRNLPLDARQLRVALAIHRGIPFRFHIDPRAPGTNVSLSWK